jgi:hypothetical protein
LPHAALFPKENPVLLARVIYTVGLLCVASAQASQSDGYWLPDSKTVERIEQAIRHAAPPATGDLTATSVDNYGRYYTGVTLNGHRVVYGVFLSMDPTRYPRGIHIVPFEDQPHMTGGGCSQLNVWYDVSEERVTEFHCYGLG